MFNLDFDIVIVRCLVSEDKESDIAKKMANVIAVKASNEESQKV